MPALEAIFCKKRDKYKYKTSGAAGRQQAIAGQHLATWLCTHLQLRSPQHAAEDTHRRGVVAIVASQLK